MSSSKPLAIAAMTAAVLLALGSAAFMAIQQQEEQNASKKTTSNKGELEEEETIPEEFRDAADRVKKLSVSDTQTLLRMYGLYKRVTVGLANPKDKSWEPTARAKWNAWNDCRDISRDEAIALYIDMVNELCKASAAPTTAAKKVTMGPKVSKMVDSSGSAQSDSNVVEFKDSKIFDEIREDFSKLSTLLETHPDLISARDENGLTLLHWAVDCDCLEAVFHLVERGAEVDTRDNDGFTPLGYAASSDLVDIAVFLKSAGADAAKASIDKPAWELTRDQELKRKLQM